MLVTATDGWSTGQAERCAPLLPVSHPLTLLPLHPDARGSSEPPLSISADEEWAGETDRERDPVLMLISALPSVTRGSPLPVPARVPPRPGRYPALASSVGAGRVAWPLAVRLGPRADRGSRCMPVQGEPQGRPSRTLSRGQRLATTQLSMRSQPEQARAAARRCAPRLKCWRPSTAGAQSRWRCGLPRVHG